MKLLINRKVLYGDAKDVSEGAHESIRIFFEGKVLADALVFHGTPFLPRSITAGELMSPVRMKRRGIAFTYYTRANEDIYSGKKEIAEGRKGIHFSGRFGESYAQNGVQFDEDLSEHQRQQEIAKGGLGGGAVAIKIGDALKQAPFIGTAHDSHTTLRAKYAASVRSGVVTLTKESQQKLGDTNYLATFIDTDDLIFLTQPRSAEGDDMYDYGFPLDMMIEIGADHQEATLSVLRGQGWTDQMINDRVCFLHSNMPKDKRSADFRVARQVHAWSCTVSRWCSSWA